MQTGKFSDGFGGELGEKLPSTPMNRRMVTYRGMERKMEVQPATGLTQGGSSRSLAAVPAADKGEVRANQQATEIPDAQTE